MKPSLASIWTCALRDCSPDALVSGWNIRKRSVRPGSALLFWGKAARATERAIRRAPGRPGPTLVISPENSDHPLPGRRSFHAGKRLLEFFDFLGRTRASRLAVFLSGGASSLAWIKPARLSQDELRRKLEALYRRPLTIRQLNRERSRLCELKGGGAAQWVRALAPKLATRSGTRVFVLSDVAPFGVETVGSGPFIGLQHELLADNSTLVRAAVKHMGRERRLSVRHSHLGAETRWSLELAEQIRRALRGRKAGIIIRGGEPQVSLRARAGRGGRQCQIAARLALRYWEEIRAGKVEILCASSDGTDGTSGAAAVHLRRGTRMPRMSASLQRQLKKAIAGFDTAPLLQRHGFLIPARATGTNLQDLILIRIAPA